MFIGDQGKITHDSHGASGVKIIPEEKMLTKVFGQQYIDYQSKVRRWL